MTQYAGMDVSLEASYVCVVDAEGKIVREAKVLSEPDALISWFAGHKVAMERIGSRVAVAVARRVHEQGRLDSGAAGDPPRARSLQDHADEDRQEGCPRYRFPTLKPGDTVVMDNLPAYKVSGIREQIEVVGARLLYLPTYSPDFNSIELAFAQLKALLRSAAARTIADLRDATRRSLTRVALAECRAYLAAAGYDAT